VGQERAGAFTSSPHYVISRCIQIYNRCLRLAETKKPRFRSHNRELHTDRLPVNFTSHKLHPPQAYLQQEEDHRRKLIKALGPQNKGALAIARAVKMLRARHKSEMAELLAAMITLPAEHCGFWFRVLWEG
jgi:hypothetical protein